MNELLRGIFGDGEMKKLLPIIIIAVILIALYLLNKKSEGFLGLLKDFPIGALLGGGK